MKQSKTLIGCTNDGHIVFAILIGQNYPLAFPAYVIKSVKCRVFYGECRLVFVDRGDSKVKV